VQPSSIVTSFCYNRNIRYLCRLSAAGLHYCVSAMMLSRISACSRLWASITAEVLNNCSSTIRVKLSMHESRSHSVVDFAVSPMRTDPSISILPCFIFLTIFAVFLPRRCCRLNPDLLFIADASAEVRQHAEPPSSSFFIASSSSWAWPRRPAALQSRARLADVRNLIFSAGSACLPGMSAD